MEEIVTQVPDQEGLKKTWATYEEFVRDADLYARTTAEAAVRFGYALKYARDTGILQQSGYTTMRDFARERYGLQEAAASRFIGICEKYSVGGDSMSLQQQYRKYNISQLTEMLNLPDGLIEAIPEDMTRDEIRDIRKEYRNEEKVTDIERMIDAAEASGEPEEEDLAQTILKAYFREHRELLAAVGNVETGDDLAGILSASGHFYAKARGADRIKRVMTGTGASDPVYISNIRTGDKEDYNWDDLLESAKRAAQAVSMEEPEKEEETPARERDSAASPEKQDENSCEISENAARERDSAASPEKQEQNSTDFKNENEGTASGDQNLIKPRDFPYMNAPETDKIPAENTDPGTVGDTLKGEVFTPARERDSAASPEIQDENSCEISENAAPERDLADSRHLEGAENGEIAQAQDERDVLEWQEDRILEEEEKLKEYLTEKKYDKAQETAFDLYREIGYLRARLAREKAKENAEDEGREENY